MNATTKTLDDDPLLTPKETAKRLNLSVSWLAKSRGRGDGPRFQKMGRAVRYLESEIRAYLRAHTRSPTSER